jgi:hypothetical protein
MAIILQEPTHSGKKLSSTKRLPKRRSFRGMEWLSGDQKHRNVEKRLIGSHRGAKREPVHVGHDHIGDNEVGS